MANPDILGHAERALTDCGLRVERGASWSTDAPLWETAAAITAARARAAGVVEMEAAGLYAFASARRKAVLCVAHVTNRMGQIEGDFEKGEAGGAADALTLIKRVTAALSTGRDV